MFSFPSLFVFWILVGHIEILFSFQGRAMFLANFLSISARASSFLGCGLLRPARKSMSARRHNFPLHSATRPKLKFQLPCVPWQGCRRREHLTAHSEALAFRTRDCQKHWS